MDEHIITKENYCIYNGVKFYFEEESGEYTLEMAEGKVDTLVIPSTINDIPVTAIHYEEWKTCEFNEVIVSDDNLYFEVINGVLFTKDMKSLLIYPPKKKDEKYAVPKTVEIIEQDAFSCNDYIKTIIFQNGVRKIYPYALSCCHNLETVYLPKTIELVSLKTFYWVGALRNVFFEGTQQEWDNIDIAFGNSELENADIHFNCHKIQYHI